MPVVQIIVLALIQGITEFLPISSSAHLILASRLIGWADQGLQFDIAVHFGSLVAVIVYLRRDLLEILRSLAPGGARESAGGRRLAAQLIVATLPVALCGWLFQESIVRYTRDLRVIAVCSIAFGLLLWLADRRGRHGGGLDGLGWAGVLAIGAAQALALLPGTSRSGVVITAALALGLVRTEAARLSFLMAVPVLLLAGGKDLLDLTTISSAEPDWFSLGLGLVVSATFAYVAVAWLVRWLERQGLAMFAIYRVLLGLALLVFQLR